MIIQLDPKKKQYIDLESEKLHLLLETTPEEPTLHKQSRGSIANQVVEDWTDKLVDAPIILRSILGENIVAIKECYNGQCIGFNEESYIQFTKLVGEVYKDKLITNSVSKKFIEEKLFRWCIERRKNEHSRRFSDFILSEIQQVVKVYYFHFPIHNLEIFAPFFIGNVKFHYFTKQDFDHLAAKYSEKHREKEENPFEVLRKKYQGHVLCVIGVQAEKNKAKEIAFERCAISMDVLKMFSEATYNPSSYIGFDIDRRTKEIIHAEVIFHEESETDNFLLDFDRIAKFHTIGENDWEQMRALGLPFIHEFLKKLSDADAPNELERLIINSINRYANAMSTANLHQRIVEIFTIFESLLLRDENAQIIESVCKYAPKLIFQKLEDRKEVIRVFKTLYQVRSAMVHHARQKDFNLDDLRKIQLSVIMLLISLVQKVKSHSSKTSLLNEIDDATLSAYPLE